MNNDVMVIESNLPMTKEQVIAQKSLVRQVMESVMKENTHYGVIPGCKVPSLYKAGSEAILATFRIAVDPQVEDLSTNDCFRYRVTCRGILPSGEIVGAGIGEASTDEEKYRWRQAISMAEFEATPEDRRRFKYLKEPYPTWNKEGIVRQVRTNPADLANTVLKMAKKRGQIDLTLTCTACSDVFVQDLEDLSEELREELVGGDAPKTGGKPAVDPPQTKTQAQGKTTTKAPESKPAGATGSGSVGTITEAQGKMLYAKIKSKNMPGEVFFKHFGITRTGELTEARLNEARKFVDEWVPEEVKPETAAAAEELPVKCNNCGEIGSHHSDCPYGE